VQELNKILSLFAEANSKLANAQSSSPPDVIPKPVALFQEY
jgi:hypothetical protein